MQNRTVLELGAGTGAVGLSAAALGASHVVLSDVDSTATLAGEQGWEERGRLLTLEENVRLNGERAKGVSVQALRWGDDAHIAELCTRWPHGFETVVGSDILYSPRMYGALAATIHAFATDLLILAFPVRHDGEEDFFSRLTPEFECVRRVSPNAAATRDKVLQIVEMRRHMK